jgi:hypothetical protein
MLQSVPERLRAKLALIADRVGSQPDALWEWAERTAGKLGVDVEDALESALGLGKIRSDRHHVFELSPNVTGDRWGFSLMRVLENKGGYDTIFSQEGFTDADEALKVVIQIINAIKNDDYDVEIQRDHPLKKPPDEESDSGFTDDGGDDDVPF